MSEQIWDLLESQPPSPPSYTRQVPRGLAAEDMVDAREEERWLPEQVLVPRSCRGEEVQQPVEAQVEGE